MSHKFPAVSVFSTARGWFALLGTDKGLRRVTFGHATREEALATATHDAAPEGGVGKAGSRVGNPACPTIATKNVISGSVRQTGLSVVPTLLTHTPVQERDWHPELRERCEAFAEGAMTSFPAVTIDRDRPLTAFQQRVVEIVQAIPPGETLTYGQVATLAGSPGAARAVGQVMATNPVPLVIPCHRVVGACGHLGGFSAPGGIATKQALLALEQTAALAVSH